MTPFTLSSLLWEWEIQVSLRRFKPQLLLSEVSLIFELTGEGLSAHEKVIGISLGRRQGA